MRSPTAEYDFAKHREVCGGFHLRNRKIVRQTHAAWLAFATKRFMSGLRRVPHFEPATWRKRAAASIKSDLPSGNAPTARVLRRISRSSRSSGLFGSQTAPVLPRKYVVIERLLNPSKHSRRYVRQLHLFQLRRDWFGFLARRRAIFLRVNGFQHRRNFFHFAGGYRRPHVAI